MKMLLIYRKESRMTGKHVGKMPSYSWISILILMENKAEQNMTNFVNMYREMTINSLRH